VRLLRELVMAALQQRQHPPEPAAVLRVGTSDGHWMADVDTSITEAAVRQLVATLITADSIRAALSSLPLETAAREVIDGFVQGHTEKDELVGALKVLSTGARTLAFVRQVPPGDDTLIDPVEVPYQADVGSGEFGLGWWAIRAQVGEPARQWVELLEGRFPRARRH
jgi:hypothetical protein